MNPPRNLLTQLNAQALKVALSYEQLRFKKLSVRTPYFANYQLLQLREALQVNGITLEQRQEIEVKLKSRNTDFAWFRGKATPSELEESLPLLIERSGLSTDGATAYGLEELMKFYGLGVDCSGFVFNLLITAFAEVGLADTFINSLNWQEGDRTVFRAGAAIFSGNAAVPILPAEVRPLDHILISTSSGVEHVALILQKGRHLLVAQSSLVTEPTGVTLTPFVIESEKPRFKAPFCIGTPWDVLYARGQLRFHRLKCFDDLVPLGFSPA